MLRFRIFLFLCKYFSSHKSKTYTFCLQVEISANRHSGGSDKYSVVDKNDEEEEADTSYAIIDMTDPVPR